jgi:transposase-like protein
VEHRKVVDEREARALLAKAARSGADLVAVARAHGVDGRSLNAWRYNLARGARPPAAPVSRRPRRAGLIELVPTELRDRPRSSGGARYTLRVEGAEIEFGDDARTETLRRVLEALRCQATGRTDPLTTLILTPSGRVILP